MLLALLFFVNTLVHTVGVIHDDKLRSLFGFIEVFRPRVCGLLFVVVIRLVWIIVRVLDVDSVDLLFGEAWISLFTILGIVLISVLHVLTVV